MRFWIRYRLDKFNSSIKEKFAYFYWKRINPDVAWCSLVMWFLGYDTWEGVHQCTGCDYCGRASFGELPKETLRTMIPCIENLMLEHGFMEGKVAITNGG